jgi:mRNA interferase YafQ
MTCNRYSMLVQMREINQTGQFKRDLKREAKGVYRAVLAQEFTALVKLLATDAVLPEKYRDHALTGDWKDHRDCHIKL